MAKKQPSKKAAGKRGRKPKFTRETIDDLCKYVRQGNYLKIAAELCGVTERSVHRWIADAKAAKRPTELQRHLRQSLTRAEAEAEAVHVQVIYKAAVGGDWRASASYLERKHHDRWGKRDAVNVRNVDKHGEDVQPTGVLVVPATSNSLEEWQEQYASQLSDGTSKAKH